MFDLSRVNVKNNNNMMVDDILIETGEINKNAMNDILKEDGFVFPIM